MQKNPWHLYPVNCSLEGILELISDRFKERGWGEERMIQDIQR